MVVTGTPQPTTTAEYTSNQLGYLESRIRRLVGDGDSEKWTHANIMDAIVDAVDIINEDGRISQQYEVIGSDNSRYFNPTINATRKAMLCYFVAILLLLGAKSKAARVAINFSNPAGSTNLINVPKEIKDSISALRSQLNALIEREWRKPVEEDGMSILELTTQE